MMDISGRLLLLMVFLSNVLTGMLIAGLCNFMITKTVFDLDQIRQDHMSDVKYYYVQGCTQGTNYPEEYKKPTIEFNQNSPSMWCNQFKEEMNDSFNDSTYGLGRRYK